MSEFIDNNGIAYIITTGIYTKIYWSYITSYIIFTIIVIECHGTRFVYFNSIQNSLLS